MRKWSKLAPLALIGLAAIGMVACSRSQSGPSSAAVAIEKGDVCTVCGMYIEGQPGPRGEAFVRGSAKALKFGSTRDFFAFVTQPDEAHRLRTLYVQDVAKIHWGHPSKAASSFTDARKATYVAWQARKGAMGPTFASFARRSDAEAFRKRFGGVLLQFAQITPQIVSALGYRCPLPGSPAYGLAAHCLLERDTTALHSMMPRMRGNMAHMREK
jgi:copper chaperone NosL